MSEQVRMVDIDTVQIWIKSDTVVIVDVRERHEFEAEHIAGAHLLPLSEFDPSRVPSVPTDKHLLLHCRSAQRCGIAASQLIASGYQGDINRLAGGMLAWVASGAPVVNGQD